MNCIPNKINSKLSSNNKNRKLSDSFEFFPNII